MKKIIIASILILLVVVLIFVWLISRNSDDTTSTSPFSTSEESERKEFLPFGRSRVSPSVTAAPIGIGPTGRYNNTLVQRLQLLMPYSSIDFEIVFSPELGKYLITKKSANADAAIRKWAEENGISQLLTSINGTGSSSNVFLIRDISSTINKPTITSGFTIQTNNTPFTNRSIQSLPLTQRQTLNELKSKPQNTETFAIQYSSKYDTFIVEKKNTNATSQINQWANSNNIPGIINNPGVFAQTSGSAATFEVEAKQLSAKGISPTPFNINEELKTTSETMALLFGSSGEIAQNPPFENIDSEDEDVQFSDFPDTDILELINLYGLPPPTAEFFNGANGYEDLKGKLTNAKAAWAARQLLNAERIYESKNPTTAGLPKVNRYITTAWVWFENGASSWPDPYMINCNDNRSGYVSEVHFLCNVNNFQVAGYQAATRRNDYVRVFSLLYNESQLVERLQGVLSNDGNAARDIWKYSSGGQQKGLVADYKSGISQATLNDISPNTSFSQGKSQFLSLLLGKDPGMVIGLNTFAISDNDLIRGIKTQNCVYGYICPTEKQLLSNMIAALYLFDTGSTNLNPPSISNPIASSPFAVQIKQIINEIKGTCTRFGPGVVNSRNVNCLDNVKSLTPLARRLMKASATRYAHLQCVGFVVGMVAQSTGADISGRGHAIDYSINSIPGYRFMRKESTTPQVNDLVVFYYDTYGHIAVITHVYDNNRIEVAEANTPTDGFVRTSVKTVKGSSIKGWLRKI